MSEQDYIGPAFLKRFNTQKTIDNWMKAGEIPWEIRSGDYSEDGCGNPYTFYKPDPEDWPKIERKNELDLVVAEETFRDILEQLLRDPRSKKPIIALDVGGMAGVTWCRLANHFKKQVKSGEMVFVVTNVEANFRNMLNQAVDRDDLQSEHTEVLEKTKGLVRYITAHAMSLRKTEISVPRNKKPIPLLGSVSLLSERSAVSAHSRIPEIHLPRLIELLSQNGIFVCCLGTMCSTMFPDLPNERLEALLLTREYLVDRLGLEYVPEVEEGKYKGEELKPMIFRKPGGPKIKVD